MRKSNIRRWFHLVIDFIPLFIIPVFMLYARNENAEMTQSITTSGYEVRNKYETKDIDNYEDFEPNILYHMNRFDAVAVGDGYYFTINIVHCSDITYQDGSNENLSETFVTTYNANENNYIQVIVADDILYQRYTNNNAYVETEISNGFISYNNIDFYLTDGQDLQSFIDHYSDYNDYDSYGLSKSDFNVLEYVWNDGIVLDSTDVGSQFMYSMYIPVKQMFNFTELGGFKQLYQWLSLNLFEGVMPIPMFIVFNILIYNFFVDIIFLLYSVFMFVIDFTEGCLDKFMNRSRC